MLISFFISLSLFIYIYNLEQLVLFSCLTIIFHSPKIQNYTYPPVAKTRLILSSLHLKTYNKIIQLRATGQQQLNDNCWRITVNNEEIDRPFFVLLFFSAFENDVQTSPSTLNITSFPTKLESRITNVFNGLTSHQHIQSISLVKKLWLVYKTRFSRKYFALLLAASTKERVNFFSLLHFISFTLFYFCDV